MNGGEGSQEGFPLVPEPDMKSVAGGHESLARIVEWYGGMVYQTCRRVIGEHTQAEDATQAVFLILAKRPEVVCRNLAGYLHAVAVRVAMRARQREDLRRRRSRQAALAREALRSPNGRQMDVRSEILGDLDQSIERLPRMQRAAVITRYLQGHTEAESAKRLGISRSALDTHLRRAIEKLRVRLTRGSLHRSVALLPGILAELAARASCPPSPGNISALSVGPGSLGAGDESLPGVPKPSQNAILLAKEVIQMIFWAKVQTVACLVAVAATVGAVMPLALRSARAQEEGIRPQMPGKESAPPAAPSRVLKGKVLAVRNGKPLLSPTEVDLSVGEPDGVRLGLKFAVMRDGVAVASAVVWRFDEQGLALCRVPLSADQRKAAGPFWDGFCPTCRESGFPSAVGSCPGCGGFMPALTRSCAECAVRSGKCQGCLKQVMPPRTAVETNVRKGDDVEIRIEDDGLVWARSPVRDVYQQVGLGAVKDGKPSRFGSFVAGEPVVLEVRAIASGREDVLRNLEERLTFVAITGDEWFTLRRRSKEDHDQLSSLSLHDLVEGARRLEIAWKDWECIRGNKKATSRCGALPPGRFKVQFDYRGDLAKAQPVALEIEILPSEIQVALAADGLTEDRLVEVARTALAQWAHAQKGASLHTFQTMESVPAIAKTGDGWKIRYQDDNFRRWYHVTVDRTGRLAGAVEAGFLPEDPSRLARSLRGALLGSSAPHQRVPEDLSRIHSSRKSGFVSHAELRDACRPLVEEVRKRLADSAHLGPAERVPRLLAYLYVGGPGTATQVEELQAAAADSSVAWIQISEWAEPIALTGNAEGLELLLVCASRVTQQGSQYAAGYEAILLREFYELVDEDLARPSDLSNLGQWSGKELAARIASARKWLAEKKKRLVFEAKTGRFRVSGGGF